jgi:hypothetical protein
MFTSLRQAADKVGSQPQGQGGGQPPAKSAADYLKNYGRFGDTQLIHISTKELEELKKSGRITRNPHTGLPEAFSLGGALGGLASGGLSLFGGGGGSGVGGVAGRLFGTLGGGAAADRTNQADTLANTMNDPHRAQSQQQYSNDLANPSSYFSSNPYAKNALSAAQNLIGAESAKSGNPTNVEATEIPQVMQSIGQNYNQLLGTEQVGAGLNQGAGYSGVAGNTPWQVGQQQLGSLFGGIMNGGSALLSML